MILEAENIRYFYKSRRDKMVLENVSAAFEEAVFYAVTGPSGSGKTTFLSLLAGLDNPAEGRILYEGEDIRKKGLNYHRRHHVSLVFQNYNLIDYLTAEENVKLGGTRDAGELLQKVGILCGDWRSAAAGSDRPRSGRRCEGAARGRTDRESGRRDSRRHYPAAEKDRP